MKFTIVTPNDSRMEIDTDVVAGFVIAGEDGKKYLITIEEEE